MPLLEAILKPNLLNFFIPSVTITSFLKDENENKDKPHYKLITFILLKLAQTTSEITFTLE